MTILSIVLFLIIGPKMRGNPANFVSRRLAPRFTPYNLPILSISPLFRGNDIEYYFASEAFVAMASHAERQRTIAIARCVPIRVLFRRDSVRNTPWQRESCEPSEYRSSDDFASPAGPDRYPADADCS